MTGIKPEELVKYTKYPHIAMGEDGVWWNYNQKPEPDDEYSQGVWFNEDHIPNIELKGIKIDYSGHWEDSLFSREKKLVSLEWEDRELLRGKWIKEKEVKREYLITEIMDDGVNLNGHFVDYANLFHMFAFSDGSPIGKEVVE